MIKWQCSISVSMSQYGNINPIIQCTMSQYDNVWTYYSIVLFPKMVMSQCSITLFYVQIWQCYNLVAHCPVFQYNFSGPACPIMTACCGNLQFWWTYNVGGEQVGLWGVPSLLSKRTEVARSCSLRVLGWFGQTSPTFWVFVTISWS